MSCISFSELKPKLTRFYIDDVQDKYVNIIPAKVASIIEMQREADDDKAITTGEVQAEFVSRCVVDDERQPLMTREQALSLSPAQLSVFFEQVVLASGMNKSKEDAEKN